MIFSISHPFKFTLLRSTFLAFPYSLFSFRPSSEYIYIGYNMKDFGSFSVLAMLIGIGFVCLVYSTKDGAFSSSGTTLTWQGNDVTATIKNRKLKDNGGHVPSLSESGVGKVNLEDYRPIDPVPNSKASIKPGPIQHGTPLMPYIPQPAPAPPPSPSKPEGFP